MKSWSKRGDTYEVFSIVMSLASSMILPLAYSFGISSLNMLSQFPPTKTTPFSGSIEYSGYYDIIPGVLWLQSLMPPARMTLLSGFTSTFPSHLLHNLLEEVRTR